MLQALYFFTLTMTLTFMFMSHPLSMGLILLIQTTVIAMITGMMSHNYWFSYILFMVMIGGMLVLFIYMTSVASNEKFLFSTKILMMIMFMGMLTFISMFLDSLVNYQLSTNMDMTNNNYPLMFNISLSKYLNYPLNMIMIMMIIYLLITMIAVVKITNIMYGPLRQKF